MILVKEEDKKQIAIMNTPAGRLMKCFLRDMYMVNWLFINLPILEWYNVIFRTIIKNNSYTLLLY